MCSTRTGSISAGSTSPRRACLQSRRSVSKSCGSRPGRASSKSGLRRRSGPASGRTRNASPSAGRARPTAGVQPVNHDRPSSISPSRSSSAVSGRRTAPTLTGATSSRGRLARRTRYRPPGSEPLLVGQGRIARRMKQASSPLKRPQTSPGESWLTSSRSPSLLDQRPSFSNLAACRHSLASAYRAILS